MADNVSMIFGHRLNFQAKDASMLDVFAAHALAGLLAGDRKPPIQSNIWEGAYAEKAYELAGAMLDVRSNLPWYTDK